MRLHRKLLVLLVGFFLLLGACADGDDEAAETPAADATPTDTATTPDGDGDAAIEISDPEDGSAVDAGDVTVAVDVTDFEVVDKLGEDPVEGEGHIHFFLDIDEEELPTEADEPAVTEEGTYMPTTETSHTWEDVEAGEHTFCAMLVDNDHTALEDPVSDCVTVDVE